VAVDINVPACVDGSIAAAKSSDTPECEAMYQTFRRRSSRHTA
jgi:hypothetical protein